MIRFALLVLVLSGSPRELSRGSLAVDAGMHAHWWHYSNVQHAVPCHSDSVCCLCGKAECSGVPGCYIGPPPGHGPFAPGGLLTLPLQPDGGSWLVVTGPFIDGGPWPTTLTINVDGGSVWKVLR